MKKMFALLAAAIMLLSAVSVAPFSVSAAGVPSVEGYQFKVMQDFESLSPGYKFGGKDDTGYTLYLNDATAFAGDVGTHGYKDSNTFRLYGLNDKGGYAQPLINMLGYGEENCQKEFVGATEMWMWVDFTNIEFDSVSMQFRVVETDCNPDGTPSTGALSQFTLNKGKPVYIQADSKSWKEISVTDQDKLPVEKMKGYKGFIRMPLSSMEVNYGEDLDGKINLENVTQLWFVFNWPDKGAKMSFAIDQVLFVGPELNDGKDVSRIKLTDTNQKGSGDNKPDDTTAAPTEVPTTAAPTEAPTEVPATEAPADTTAAEPTPTTAASGDSASTTAPANGEEAESSGSHMVWLWVALGVAAAAGIGAAVYFLVAKKK